MAKLLDILPPKSEISWVQKLKERSMEIFQRIGLPQPKTEVWKYTKPRDLFADDFSTEAPKDIEAFRHTLDKKLQSLNSDYEAKRYLDTTLRELELIVAKPNLFYNWLKNHNKLGGQHKIPRLSNSREFIEDLIELNEKM